MFGAIQVTSVWLTTAMLFVQAVCPGLAGDCGCQPGNAFCGSTNVTESNICRCSSSAGDASLGCPHCQRASGKPEPTMQSESVCHCGDQAPVEPTMPGVPESPSSSVLLDWIGGSIACFTTAPLLSPAPVHSQVPSSMVLIPHFKQVVHCVWLT